MAEAKEGMAEAKAEAEAAVAEEDTLLSSVHASIFHHREEH